MLALAEPERTSQAAGQQQLRAFLVEPGRRHRPVQLLQRLRRAAAREPREGEDDLRVDRHLGVGALDSVLLEELVVVLDDPVVDPDHRAVADRMIVRLEARVALGEVADVDEQLRRILGDADPLEQGRRAGALFVDGDRSSRGPVGIADGVGAALGDSGQQGAGGDCPLDAAPRSEAISGYSAQSLLR